MPEPLVANSDKPLSRRWLIWVMVLFLYILTVGVGLSLGREFSTFAIASFEVLPFVGLAVLAYFAGQKFNWAWIAAGVWLSILIGLTALYAVALGVVSLLPPEVLSSEALSSTQPPPFTPQMVTGVLVLISGVLIAIGVGALTLLPATRRFLARFIPIDPESFVHTIALMAIVTITLILFMPLLITAQLPLAALVEQISVDESTSNAEQLRSLVYRLVWTIPAAFLAVGFGIRRDLSTTLSRLGFVYPTSRHLLLGITLGLGLAGLVFLLTPLIDRVWQAFGWPTTDKELFGELLAFALSPIGAVVVGVTAGLGEELAVRGVLQPRMGIWLSNLFFVSLHALQYHWDGLLIVFVVGMICGLVRKYTNTTTAAILHGVYNFAVVMLAVLLGP